MATLHRSGIGPHTILPGDMFCTLKGWGVPVVSRRCRTNRYAYVGTRHLEEADHAIRNPKKETHATIFKIIVGSPARLIPSNAL